MFEGHALFSLKNVYRAYRRCRRRKRGTVNALRFEATLEENLVALHEELSSGTYRPGRSVAFLLNRRFHERDEPMARELLWRSAVPVAWIGETGRRVGSIAERALVSRWACWACKPLPASG